MINKYGRVPSAVRELTTYSTLVSLNTSMAEAHYTPVRETKGQAMLTNGWSGLIALCLALGLLTAVVPL